MAKNVIYAPGRLQLEVLLTDNATMVGDYSMRVSVDVAESIVGKKCLSVSKGEAGIVEIEFDGVRDRTDARYRVELFLDGKFAEAFEEALTLWPAPDTSMDLVHQKTIWVFDASGTLQQMFREVTSDFFDATFQPVRDFVNPDIAFVGEHAELGVLEAISGRLNLVDANVVVVFLRQRELPENWPVGISGGRTGVESIDCNMDCPVLEKLDKFDIMDLVKNAAGGVRVKERSRKDVSADSYVTVLDRDKGGEKSYLLGVKGRKRYEIYCQLPITTYEDPRCDLVFRNILEFACAISDLEKTKDN